MKNGSKAEWGPCIWGELHEVAGKIPCSECKPFGVRAMRAVHDMVNVKLGKPVFDPAGLLLFKREVENAVSKCHRVGVCTGRIRHVRMA